MLRKYALIVFVFLLIGIVGCAGTNDIALSDEARYLTHSVSIDPNIPVNQDITLFGGTQATDGVLGGGIGGVVSESMEQDDKTLLKSLITKNNIKVDRYFYEAFKSLLEHSHTFPKVVEKGGDAVFKITIKQYGLLKKSAFNSDLRAAVWADVILVRKNDGEIIWQKHFHPKMPEDRLPAHDLEFYQQHPEELRKGFVMAIQILAKEAVGDLNGTKSQ